MTFDGSKIKEIATRKGISMYSLAKGTGITQAALSKIVNCKTDNPRGRTLLAIADFLDVSPTEIGAESGPVKPTIERGPSVSVYSPKAFADYALGRQSLEPEHLITYPFSETDVPDESIISEDYLEIGQSELVCLRVKGSSAMPLYADGDLLFIRVSDLDEISSFAGDTVAVCILGEKDREYAAVRKIIIDEAEPGKFWAKPINPEYPDQQLIKNPRTVGYIVNFIGKPRN